MGKKYLDLLETKSDPVSGLLRHTVNSYVADTRHLRTRVARWISQKNSDCPGHRPRSQFSVHGRQAVAADIEFLTPGLYLSWDEDEERQRSLHLWSAEYPDKLSVDYFNLRSTHLISLFFQRLTIPSARKSPATNAMYATRESELVPSLGGLVASRHRAI